ncbi:MAG: response regulator [Thermodesulfobacteriota bacterium]|nr:response regulator [Thermodesulfobacteriota bacterium]
MDDCNILLVDDETEFLETLVKRLKKRRLNISGVKSGEEALVVVGEKGIDVVVLDVRMPGIDGLQTLKKLKEVNPLIEVIMLTGHASLEVAVEGMESGAFDYLMKPIDIDELLYKIEDAHNKKKIQEEKIKSMERMRDSLQ